jgi:hypothetical protein
MANVPDDGIQNGKSLTAQPAGSNQPVIQVPQNPSAVCRIYEDGKPKFQLRKGEEGLSVFDADKIKEADILPNFRPESMVTTQQRKLIESFGLRIEKTPGDPNLPQLLQDNHWEIRPGDNMTRHQFKVALKDLEAATI